MRIFHTLRTCKWRQTQTWQNIGRPLPIQPFPRLATKNPSKSLRTSQKVDWWESLLHAPRSQSLEKGQQKHHFRMPQQRESLSETQLVKNECPSSKWSISIYIHPLWLVVSTHLKSISQNGNLPQIGVKIKNIWNILKAPPRIYIPSPSFSSKLQTLKKVMENANKKLQGLQLLKSFLFSKSLPDLPTLQNPKLASINGRFQHHASWLKVSPCASHATGEENFAMGGKVASFEFRRTRCPKWRVSQKIDGASSLTSMHSIAFEHDSLLNYFPGVTDFEIIRTFCMKRTTHVFFCWIVQTWLRRRRFSPKFGLQRRKGQIKWISTAPWNEQHMISIYIYI